MKGNIYQILKIYLLFLFLLAICSCLDEKNPVSVPDNELPRGYIHLITDQTEYEYFDKISITIVNLTDTSAIIKMKDSRPTYTLEKYQGKEWKIHHQNYPSSYHRWISPGSSLYISEMLFPPVNLMEVGTYHLKIPYYHTLGDSGKTLISNEFTIQKPAKGKNIIAITNDTLYSHLEIISLNILNFSDSAIVLEWLDKRPTYTLEYFSDNMWKKHHDRYSPVSSKQTITAGNKLVIPNMLSPVPDGMVAGEYRLKIPYRFEGGGEKDTLLSNNFEVEILKDPEVVADGLIAYYPFDGDALDYSHNNFDGIIMGNPEFKDGIRGQCLSFDGFHDYVRFTAENSPFPITVYSVVVWLNSPGIGHSQNGMGGYILGSEMNPDEHYEIPHIGLLNFWTNWGVIESIGVVHRFWGGGISFEKYRSVWTMFTVQIAYGGPYFGSPYYVFHEININDGGFSGLYPDSLKSKTGEIIGGIPFYFGSNSDRDTLDITRFNGYLDEVRIYNRYLHKHERQTIYNYYINNMNNN